MKQETIDNQRICDKLVSREVVACASPLVSELLEHPDTWRFLGIDEEDMYGLASTIDYEQAARDWVLDADANQLEDAFGWDIVDEDPSGDAMESFRKQAGDELDKYSAAEFQKFCLDNDINMEDYGREAYEHWIVTSYFADKLKDKGEIVGELFNWHIWGRCTTGQAISMDGVIQQIASDMGILSGQRNEWKE
jgi:hypothetical protein